ncbi:hypothetical protein D3C86_1781380 [compost metagenome]
MARTGPPAGFETAPAAAFGCGAPQWGHAMARACNGSPHARQCTRAVIRVLLQLTFKSPALSERVALIYILMRSICIDAHTAWLFVLRPGRFATDDNRFPLGDAVRSTTAIRLEIA